MSAYKKEGKFYISTDTHYDVDDGLYYIYVGEKKPNGFMELHFKAAGRSKEVAMARAEYMCILWSAVRPNDLKVIDKTIDDILNTPED